jgi:subtilisin family serine protease
MLRVVRAGLLSAGLCLLVPGSAAATLPRVNLLDPLSKEHSWGLANIDAGEAWTASTGAGVTVAVIDSGIDPGHPELRLTANGRWDYQTGTNQPIDERGHGTHVAGILGAVANGKSMTGVAPDATILDLRVLGREGTIIQGFDEALARAGDLGVRVVNASISGSYQSPSEQAAIAAHPGTLYVVSAGNGGYDNDTRPRFPCNLTLPNVICIGASNRDDARDPSSNYGATTVDLFAPGSRVFSLRPTYYPDDENAVPGLISMSGTSSAAPHVAGVAALLAAIHPEWTAAQLKQRLIDTVDPVPALQGLSVSGGRLNAAKALGVPVGPPAAPQGVIATAGPGQVTLGWSPNAESDLAGYRVYPPGGAAPVETTVAGATIAGLPNGVPVELKVAAVDLAGNESAITPVTGAAQVPPPATPVAPKLTTVRLNGRPCRVACRATLSFTLNTSAKVRFTLKRSGRRATTRTRSFSAGTHKVSMRGRVQGAVGTARPLTLRFTVRR